MFIWNDLLFYSYVPKSRKLRKKISEPVGKEKTMLRQAEANGNVSTININNNNNNNKGAMEQQERRQRHASDHSQQQERSDTFMEGV